MVAEIAAFVELVQQRDHDDETQQPDDTTHRPQHDLERLFILRVVRLVHNHACKSEMSHCVSNLQECCKTTIFMECVSLCIIVIYGS